MEPVKLKGNREGVIVQLDLNTNFTKLCESMITKIKSADGFLGTNTEVIISTGNVSLNSDQVQRVTDVLKSLGLGVKKFIPETKEDVPVKNAVLEAPQKAGGIDQYLSEGSTLLVRKNLRSGQSITHEGTVILMGDVNPGAEIIATGHIFVIGHLRGIAHAGVKGDKGAVVYANRLQPTQLRIANLITRAPDEECTVPNEPELARIKEGMVVIEKYLLI